MGTYITATYNVKCKPQEAFDILNVINSINGLHSFSFRRDQIGNKGVLEAHAWVRRMGPDDNTELDFCCALTRKFPDIRIWFHVYLNYGSYEFREYLISRGEIEGAFVYDDVSYRAYSRGLSEMVKEGRIPEQTDGFKTYETYPYKSVEKEFYKIKEGDVVTDEK